MSDISTKNKQVFFLKQADEQYRKLKRNRQTQYIKQIWELIKDINVNGNMNGIGSPERLYKEEKYIGWYSRKIMIAGEDTFNRLVYVSDEYQIIIKECVEHYSSKIKIEN